MTNESKNENMEDRVKELEAELEKHKKENRQLLEFCRKYSTIIDNANEAILVIQDGKLKLVNDIASKVAGLTPKEKTDRFFLEWVHPDDKKVVMENHLKRLKGEELPNEYDIRVVDKNKKVRWMSIRPIVIQWEGQPAMMVFMTDVTERKDMEEEKEKLIFELQGAFSKINTLKGFLPICSSCKKVRDDKGYWNQIEAYLHEHSDIEFNESLCPECSKKKSA